MTPPTPDPEPDADSLIVEAPTPERDALIRDPSTLCLNCGNALPGAYCPACGQKAQVIRQPIHHFLRDSFVEFFGIDGRVWSSLGVLLFKPGRLTRTYISGQRVKYLRPLRIYLSSTLLFFVLLATMDPAGRLGEVIQNSDNPGAADSVTVANHLADEDSVLAALPLRWAEEDSGRDSLLSQADSLRAILASDPPTDLDDLADLQDDIDDLVDDADVSSWDSPGRRAQRLDRLRTEIAVLRSFPQDSVIALSEIHDWLSDMYPTSTVEVTVGPEWMTRSRAAQQLESARTDRERLQAASQFARNAIGQIPTVMFLILPIFAFLLKLLYVRRDWFYSEHVVFALHTHAFAFVMFSILVLLVWVSGGDGWTLWVMAAMAIAIPLYFLLSMKHVYQQGWGRTLVKSWLLAWMYGFVLLVGLVGAFMLAALLG